MWFRCKFCFNTYLFCTTWSSCFSYMPNRGFSKIPIEDDSILMKELLEKVLSRRKLKEIKGAPPSQFCGLIDVGKLFSYSTCSKYLNLLFCTLFFIQKDYLRSKSASSESATSDAASRHCARRVKRLLRRSRVSSGEAERARCRHRPRQAAASDDDDGILSSQRKQYVRPSVATSCSACVFKYTRKSAHMCVLYSYCCFALVPHLHCTRPYCRYSGWRQGRWRHRGRSVRHDSFADESSVQKLQRHHATENHE